MTTLNEIAYFIAGRYDRDHDKQFVREVAFAARHWRAFLIRQDAEKNLSSGLYTQKITIPTELVDQADNCYVDLGCTVLKTTVAVPTPVRRKTHSPFAYVGTSTGKRPFSYVPFSRVFHIDYNRFATPGKAVFYTLYNGKIVLYGEKKLDYLTIAGPFEDPIAAADTCINSINCLGDDQNFYAPGDIVKTIIDGLLNGAFAITVPNDEEVTVTQ